MIDAFSYTFEITRNTQNFKLPHPFFQFLQRKWQLSLLPIVTTQQQSTTARRFICPLIRHYLMRMSFLCSLDPRRLFLRQCSQEPPCDIIVSITFHRYRYSSPSSYIWTSISGLTMPCSIYFEACKFGTRALHLILKLSIFFATMSLPSTFYPQTFFCLIMLVFTPLVLMLELL